MAKILGTNVAAAVVPFDTNDEFPTHYSEYGKGGWREVSTIGVRDAIPADRRNIGMAVYAKSDMIADGNRDIKTYGFSDILFAF